MYSPNEVMVRTYDNIVSAIGNTPLIRLTRLESGLGFALFAKIEGMNPAGSVKDRSAYAIIRRGVESGAITAGTVVVESTSGNMGIGLAQACRYYGLRLVCVVDLRTTPQNVALLRAYGAHVEIVTEPDPATGEFLVARLARVRELLDSIEGSVWTDQYSNPDNSAAHLQTMHEIVTALDGRVDYLFCSTSTCGTIRGCSEYVRSHNLPITIVAVDAIGSAIFGSHKQERRIPGHGAAIRPDLFRPELIDDHIHVSDLDCVVGCRRLLGQEAIMAGGSSGGIVTAVERMKDTLPGNSICGAILPDRGERYVDTIFSDEWVEEHFGDVQHLWQPLQTDHVCKTVIS
ncbi:MAG TPA: 2,3-diaminopropionate biosynthesis protein SbnA [Candidatus Kapabacteria bacterium]|nr:2,3-diaminopropionate biosynthesis protein SbnA [Candidatus Kapabacteria bacterium]